jgi:hypothetical protein
MLDSESEFKKSRRSHRGGKTRGQRRKEAKIRERIDGKDYFADTGCSPVKMHMLSKPKTDL